MDRAVTWLEGARPERPLICQLARAATGRWIGLPGIAGRGASCAGLSGISRRVGGERVRRRRRRARLAAGRRPEPTGCRGKPDALRRRRSRRGRPGSPRCPRARSRRNSRLGRRPVRRRTPWDRTLASAGDQLRVARRRGQTRLRRGLSATCCAPGLTATRPAIDHAGFGSTSGPDGLDVSIRPTLAPATTGQRCVAAEDGAPAHDRSDEDRRRQLRPGYSPREETRSSPRSLSSRFAELPAAAWSVMLDQDGNPLNEQASGIAEITGLSTRTGWPDEQRLIARRVRLGRSGWSRCLASDPHDAPAPEQMRSSRSVSTSSR